MTALSSPYPWVPRGERERTADYLARVLDTLGPHFADVARNARALHYDDYFCPPNIDDGANIHRLVRAVGSLIATCPPGDIEQAARAVVEAAKTGEFDGTKAESEEWAQSPEGQALFRELGIPGSGRR